MKEITAIRPGPAFRRRTGGQTSFTEFESMLTFLTGSTDLHNNDGANGDHAKLYISKWHHSIHTSAHTNTFKSTCPPGLPNVDFRNDDYYWSAGDWLEESGTLDRESTSSWRPVI